MSLEESVKEDRRNWRINSMLSTGAFLAEAICTYGFIIFITETPRTVTSVACALGYVAAGIGADYLRRKFDKKTSEAFYRSYEKVRAEMEDYAFE